LPTNASKCIETNIMQRKCSNCLFFKVKFDGFTTLRNKFKISWKSVISIQIACRQPYYTTFIEADQIKSISNFYISTFRKYQPRLSKKTLIKWYDNIYLGRNQRKYFNKNHKGRTNLLYIQQFNEVKQKNYHLR
jgi:hypothetical protein